MADRNIIQSIDDLSPRAKGELRAWIETWLSQHPIDATDNQGFTYGVRSEDIVQGVVTEGYVLTATGLGGSKWGPGVTQTPSYPEIVTGDEYAACLLGYWRLGEAALPFADSNPFLTHHDAALRVAGTNPITFHQTGALSADQDDGAAWFKGYGNTAVGGVSGDIPGISNIPGFGFGGVGSVYTVAVWVKPITPLPGGVSYANSPGIVGDQSVGALNEAGWIMSWDFTNHAVNFYRRQDGSFTLFGTSSPAGSVPANAWTFIVGIYNGTTTYIYINGVLAATGGTATGYGGGGPNGSFELGRDTTGGPSGGVGHNYFYGYIDELAIFKCALTATQISNLYLGQSVADVSTFTVYLNGS